MTGTWIDREKRMHVIIKDADWSELSRKVDEFDGIASTHSGAFRGASLTRTDERDDVIL